MFDNDRKVKKIVTAMILLGIIAIGVSGLRIQSVGQYRQEQEQLAKEILVEDPSETDLSEFSREDSIQSAFPEDGKGVQSGTGANGSEDTEDPAGQKKDSESTGSSAKQENDSDGTKKTVGQENHPKSGTDPAGQTNGSGGTDKTSGIKRSPATKKTVSGKNKSSDTASKTARKKTAPKTSVSATKKPTAKPDGRPTQIPSRSDDSFICSITIRCDSLLNHWDSLSDNMKKKIPDSGFLLEKTNMKMTTSDTAFSILQKACKAKNIALDAEFNNLFSTEYVQGIGHLYEKEAGDMSGWLYRVNGKIPSHGASGYKLQSGDAVEWVYTYSGDLE